MKKDNNNLVVGYRVLNVAFWAAFFILAYIFGLAWWQAAALGAVTYLVAYTRSGVIFSQVRGDVEDLVHSTNVMKTVAETRIQGLERELYLAGARTLPDAQITR